MAIKTPAILAPIKTPAILVSEGRAIKTPAVVVEASMSSDVTSTSKVDEVGKKILKGVAIFFGFLTGIYPIYLLGKYIYTTINRSDSPKTLEAKEKKALLKNIKNKRKACYEALKRYSRSGDRVFLEPLKQAEKEYVESLILFYGRVRPFGTIDELNGELEGTRKEICQIGGPELASRELFEIKKMIVEKRPDLGINQYRSPMILSENGHYDELQRIAKVRLEEIALEDKKRLSQKADEVVQEIFPEGMDAEQVDAEECLCQAASELAQVAGSKYADKSFDAYGDLRQVIKVKKLEKENKKITQIEEEMLLLKKQIAEVDKDKEIASLIQQHDLWIDSLRKQKAEYEDLRKEYEALLAATVVLHVEQGQLAAKGGAVVKDEEREQAKQNVEPLKNRCDSKDEAIKTLEDDISGLKERIKGLREDKAKSFKERLRNLEIVFSESVSRVERAYLHSQEWFYTRWPGKVVRFVSGGYLWS
jgi:hypothetical protein